MTLLSQQADRPAETLQDEDDEALDVPTVQLVLGGAFIGAAIVASGIAWAKVLGWI
jgi:hypothetical protein